MVCGVKEFGNSDLFHIKFKAHVKEEEMSENERRRSKLSGDVAENNPFLSKLRSRKEKEWHALKGSIPGHPKQKVLTQWASHGSMVEEQFRKKLTPPH